MSQIISYTIGHEQRSCTHESDAMQRDVPKFVVQREIAHYVQPLGDTFALVKNPPYIFPPYEAYPLAPPRTVLDDGLEAAVMDMDGTTTTTEALCIESLATMVSCITGAEKDGASRALNPARDYPHIIGNSTTRHVEYLIRQYRDSIKAEALCRHFIRSAAWNMTCGMDPRRAEEARTTLTTQGLDALSGSPAFSELCWTLRESGCAPDVLLSEMTRKHLLSLRMQDVSDLTRIGIEIYYQHYHELLAAIDRAAPGECRSGLIEPMPGIGIALALLKGWLGGEAGALAERACALLSHAKGCPVRDMDEMACRLAAQGNYFNDHPVKIALVTSSIAAEAEIVLREVFRVLVKEVSAWDVSAGLRDRIQEGFADPARFYDARITASDSSEIRLKPHRDLYSIALHALGVSPERFHRVAGFEDSESGTIAIRAAGISLCCALPFAMTKDHRFEAATRVCPGGMPEVMLQENFFLPESLTGGG